MKHLDFPVIFAPLLHHTRKVSAMSGCCGARIGRRKGAARSPQHCAQQWDGGRTILPLGPPYLQGYSSYGAILPMGPSYLQKHLCFRAILAAGFCVLPWKQGTNTYVNTQGSKLLVAIGTEDKLSFLQIHRWCSVRS